VLYKLIQRIVANRLQEAQQFFYKYTGAAFLTNGITVIQDWVSQLIEPGSTPPDLPRDQKNGRPNSSSFGNPQPGPSSPAPQPFASPPSYYSQPQSSPLARSPVPQIQILAQFNMAAQQRGFVASYSAHSEGSPHSPLWSVQCCRKWRALSVPHTSSLTCLIVNGEVKGEGQGPNQKQAKEMAARQAWTLMGWGHCKLFRSSFACVAGC
jgi:ribonuclease-3